MQALIAARLDTLSPERKSLLQDASVMGKVFWAGALAEMGDRDAREVEQALHELSRKELVRPARTSLDGGRGRVRLLAPAGQGRLLRADPPRRPRCPPPCRRRLARAQGGRAGRGPGRRARLPLPERARARRAPPARPRQAAELEASAIRYLALAGERALALDVDARRGEPGQGAGARPRRAPRARVRCSSAGRRPRSSRAASRRHETRSRRRSPSTASRTRASPPGGC